MSHILLLIFALSYLDSFSGEQWKQTIINRENFVAREPAPLSLNEIKEMLHQQAPNLNELVINKVLMSLECATAYNVNNNNIITIIDYSLASNEKRLWVFDLKEKKLLFNTYVSHGITSGSLATLHFSNKYNSKASSMGVYKTEKAYYGREGLSLRLDGLDRSFNDNASNRSIVMHGGWYMDEGFIKRYGRPGRSWGCPALPLGLYQSIINTIKENSLMVAYYPDDAWFVKSRFLNCNNKGLQPNTLQATAPTLLNHQDEQREEVIFANVSKNIKKADDNPIVAMTADDYERIFHSKAPLERMLRRQINSAEYIALSNTEFLHLVATQTQVTNKDVLHAIYFVVPVIKMIRGYYETQMQIVDLGKIKELRLNTNVSKNKSVSSYVVSFETRPAVSLRVTNRFIRWVGL